MPYLTPDVPPDSMICRTIIIPDNETWKAIVNGALLELTKAYNFEAFGSLSPDETAAFFLDMWVATHDSVCMDEKVKISVTDTTEDYLQSKIVAGNRIALTQQNVAGNENLKIDVFGLVPTDISGLNEAMQDMIASLINAGSGVTVVYDDATNTLTISAASPAPQVYPTNHNWLHAADIVTAGAAIIQTINVGQTLNGYWRQSGAAIDDEFVHDVLLDVGSYVLHMVGITASNQAVQGLYLDGTSFAFVDWYTSTTILNVTKTASFIVASGGLHQIKTHVSSKNASSTGFTLGLSYFWIEKL